MLNTPSAPIDTPQRLLAAAGEVFAEHGFHDATVRDICQRAGANVAAINYHFRDKAGLYREVIFGLYREAEEKYPLHALGPQAPADERLRAFVTNFIKRMLDEGRPAWYGKLVAREMVEPSEVMDDLVSQFIRPNFLRLGALLRELVGPGPSDGAVRRAGFSIVGQCVAYKHMQPVMDRLAPRGPYTPADVEALAEHIWRFSLAGLHAMRAEAEKQGGGA